ncbi:MAG: tRNA glutamyl-Q(34) synthetase GluQRS [Solirubrobacterales bacterium]
MPTGRYAPSPTGPLHLGNLRTALLAWLFARSAGHRFVLRIDDLDPDRSREEWAARQLEELTALGLEWDGEPLRQSERRHAYEEAIATLEGAGLLYPCFCSRREIREASQAPHGELPEGFYPGTCRELSVAEREERIAAGEQSALRVRAEGVQIGFTDRVQGSSRSAAVDDFVVRRKDGTHGYNLAVVVDDAYQGITEVVRGADLLTSTPRHLWLADQLGLPVPTRWAHVPLVLGDDGERLAKRHGAVTMEELERDGIDAAEVRGRLAASLGLAQPEERPTAAELLERFDPAKLPTVDAAMPLPAAS